MNSVNMINAEIYLDDDLVSKRYVNNCGELSPPKLEFSAVDDSRSDDESGNIGYVYLLLVVGVNPIKNSGFDIKDISRTKPVTDGSNSHILKGVMKNKKRTIVKILKANVSNEENATKEFEIEHEVLSRLSHPNIVQYYGGGFLEHRRFLLLEILQGGTLASFFESLVNEDNLRLSYFRLLDIAMQLAKAIKYLHKDFHRDLMIIHRDLKPENIAFTSKGVLKLIDFGLSAVIRRSTSSTPNATYKMTGKTGSIRYMAPEVLKSQPYNEKVDIYSFGLILWQLSTSIVPFDNIDPKHFYSRVILGHERPSLKMDPHNKKSHLNGSLRNIIEKCWDDDYQERYESNYLLQLLVILYEDESLSRKSCRCLPAGFLSLNSFF